jgi:hypothetical protein
MLLLLLLLLQRCACSIYSILFAEISHSTHALCTSSAFFAVIMPLTRPLLQALLQMPVQPRAGAERSRSFFDILLYLPNAHSIQVALCGWLMFHAARIHLQTYGSSKDTL